MPSYHIWGKKTNYPETKNKKRKSKGTLAVKRNFWAFMGLIYSFIHSLINSECKLKGEVKFLIQIAGQIEKEKSRAFNSKNNDEKRGKGREGEWERKRF